MVKDPPANAGDVRDVCSISGSGISPGGGHGNPLQYSCLENPIDRGPCWAIESRTVQLKQLSIHICSKREFEAICGTWAKVRLEASVGTGKIGNLL